PESSMNDTARMSAGCFIERSLALAKQYPAVQFYFFTPPMYQWQLFGFEHTGVAKYQFGVVVKSDQGLISVWNRMQDIVVEEAEHSSNANIYDFNAATSISDDCRRYMDLFHFDTKGNDQMVVWMRQERFKRTVETSQSIDETILANAREPVSCPPKE